MEPTEHSDDTRQTARPLKQKHNILLLLLLALRAPPPPPSSTHDPTDPNPTKWASCLHNIVVFTIATTYSYHQSGVFTQRGV